ncbi:MAG: DUF3300 domain-containing protein [Planctomycetaceae bacterium]|nr:DUF3300 domain-containing protein [Planctomycetaceae bacterium]
MKPNHVILCLLSLHIMASFIYGQQDQPVPPVTPEQVVQTITPDQPPQSVTPEQPAQPVFKQEELEQMVAPIALYPDSLISQILMASTYPLDVVMADKWVKQNPDLKGDALTSALEQQNWDPSVKSLVNFPEVLAAMSDKIELTQKLGDAFLAQQKDVMAAIQKLRRAAQEQGRLKSSDQLTVKDEQDTIIIESPDPQVIYVPSYNPTVVYGTWPYPAYPPYAYYPPSYYAGSNLLSFGLGVAAGAAWGYAWGDCDWHGGDIDVDVDRNFNSNRNINRDRYRSEFSGGKGTWQHKAQNRKGVAYRDNATASRFNRGASSQAVQNREAFRGRAETGRQQLARSDVGQARTNRPIGAGDGLNRGAGDGLSRTSDTSNRGGAMSGISNGRSDRQAASRGNVSRQNRSSGGRSAISRGGGGASRGGGARGGGRGGGRR